MNSADFKKENTKIDNVFQIKMYLENQKTALHFPVFSYLETFAEKKKIKLVVTQIMRNSINRILTFNVLIK